MSHLGIGLPDVAATGRLDAPVGKLAAGRTAITGAPDGVKLVPGDSVLLQRAVDFIKLDVEGMELQALAGLERTIARWRPRISIEVDDGNVSAFKEWLVRHHYASERTYRRYRVNENYLVGRWRRLA